MSALTKDRNTPFREGAVLSVPVKAGATIHAGSLVARESGGYAKPATAAAGLTALGRAEQAIDNSAGSDGDKFVLVRAGVFRWNNSAGSAAISAPDIGADCFMVDDQTVAKTSSGDTRSRAGTVIGIDAEGVWVRSEPGAERILTGASAIDFESIAARNKADSTVTVTGAVVGAAVLVTPPSGLETGLVCQGWVSAADTVTIRAHNITTAAIDPAAGTFRYTVIL